MFGAIFGRQKGSWLDFLGQKAVHASLARMASTINATRRHGDLIEVDYIEKWDYLRGPAEVMRCRIRQRPKTPA